MSNGTTSGAPPEAGARAGVVARTRWGAVVTFALATLIVASELSMAAIALPLIGADLGVDAGATSWVLLAYSLPLAALAMPAGQWVDRADIRLVFVISLLGVGVAGVLAALAPFFWVLIVSRVLQGFAAALYLAVYLPVITVIVRVDQRGRAMSYMATVMMLGSMALTPLGGVVAEAFGWREVFLVKLPLLALVLWMGYRTLPAGRAGGDMARRLPLPDSSLLRDVLLVGGAITAGLLAIEQIEGRWVVAVGLALGAVAMAAWWARLPTSQPVLALVRRRGFGFPALSLLLMSSVIGLVVFSLPYFIADVLRRSPEILGFAILCFVGSASVVSPIAGMLADRFAPRPVATIGGALAGCGMLTMVTLGAAAGLMDLAWRMAVIGAGMALFNAPNMSAILKAAPDGQAGTAGGISTIARTLGNSIGPAVAALAWSLGGGGTKGFRAGVVVLTGFAFAGVVAQMAGPRTQPHNAP